ncbi:hypothetical protein CH274_13225 [Rhodococcus sp. 06-418-5]|nr:hypothetical protein CH274_13225 [Rhodococcus sp. 06-418-5]
MVAGYTSMIEIERPVITRDSYGNDTFDWDNAELIPVPLPVSMQPLSQTESGDNEFRQTVTTGFRVISQAGVDIDVLDTDRIRWAGQSYDVTQIARWPHPMILNGVHHIEIQLEKVTG